MTTLERIDARVAALEARRAELNSRIDELLVLRAELVEHLALDGRSPFADLASDELAAAAVTPVPAPKPEEAALARTATRTGYALHPDTEPEAIRAAQAADVAAYLRAHPGATDDEVSAAVVLPLWNVRRCRSGLSADKRDAV